MTATSSLASAIEPGQLKALCDLSEFNTSLSAEELNHLAATAPDPETLFSSVLARMTIDSGSLQRKWRQTLTKVWSLHHPNTPHLPELPLRVNQVEHTPVLADAKGYLACIAEQPAELEEENGELVLTSRAIERLIPRLPSLASQSGEFLFENEWSYLPLRRLRALLQAARLIRPYAGKLVAIRSRLEPFLRLPATQQFYILWHTDMYHVGWGPFAGQWEAYMESVQEYLPLLWEVIGEVRAGQMLDDYQLCLETMEAFAPLWGEVEVAPVASAAHPFSLFHRCALPVVLHSLIIKDVLLRFGLITPELTWTELGATLLTVERNRKLPCGLELLR